MKLVSACLLGIDCNYEGKNKLNQKIFEEFTKGNMYPVCPEVLGGQSIPRPPSEIRNGTGLDVLNSRARVINPDGIDVTSEFIKGAFYVLELSKALGSKEAIFKARSPSCGCGKIYDGTFSGNLIDGDGVTTALLKKKGIKVMTDEEYTLKF